ncbi:plasmid pRiA4b ORF-3 family protein [Aquibacillus kalidii]|uniref:plasmid pRiA4b ORF-3 family protein n=1 Tax=Aquibacillus kalidii TaxID=2762597 RepID=UPI001F15BEB7
MPAGATFNRLHDVIQTITNFQSGNPYEPYHLFEFDLRHDNLVVTNDLEAYEENKYVKSAFKITDLNKENDPFGIMAKQLKTTVRQPQTIKIDKYLEKDKELIYNYDFGDDWRFKITLEDTTEEYYYGYPTLLDGAENAPPEDVGGIFGYYEFLEVYHDKNHPDHKKTRAWAEG